MAAATSFASTQMDWDAPDPITEFARRVQENLARDVLSEHRKDLISDFGFISCYEHDT